VTFTVTISTPSITSISPTSGPVGTSVTITGANFGSTQGTSTVTFNGTAATPSSWSDTSIVAPVPSGATTGPVVVTVGGVASNGVSFTVTVVSAQSIAQTCASAQFNTTSTTCTLGNISAGDIQVAMLEISAGTPSISGCGATWTVDPWVGSVPAVALATGTGASAGSCTITFSSTTSTTLNIVAANVTSTAGIDQRGAASVLGYVSAGSPITAPSITTTQNGDLILGLFMDTDGSGGTYTAGSGYGIAVQYTQGNAIEAGVQATAGIIAPTITYNKSVHLAAATLALKP
jgi:hypothetical protein